eukprot:9475409-Pyramimonas_sp.AAC.1
MRLERDIFVSAQGQERGPHPHGGLLRVGGGGAHAAVRQRLPHHGAQGRARVHGQAAGGRGVHHKGEIPTPRLDWGVEG